MSMYWEPWRPEVGQRVRTRVSPECTGPHVPEDDSRLAMVCVILGPEEFAMLTSGDDGHPYGVILLDWPDGYRDDDTPDQYYAAIELEPLPLFEAVTP